MRSLIVYALSALCAVFLGFDSAHADSYQAHAVSYPLDDQHTSVVFAINHLGYSSRQFALDSSSTSSGYDAYR